MESFKIICHSKQHKKYVRETLISRGFAGGNYANDDISYRNLIYFSGEDFADYYQNTSLHYIRNAELITLDDLLRRIEIADQSKANDPDSRFVYKGSSFFNNSINHSLYHLFLDEDEDFKILFPNNITTMNHPITKEVLEIIPSDNLNNLKLIIIEDE